MNFSFVCHSERSEESTHSRALSVRFHGFFATLRMTNVGLLSSLWIWTVHPRVPRNVGHRIAAGLMIAGKGGGS